MLVQTLYALYYKKNVESDKIIQIIWIEKPTIEQLLTYFYPNETMDTLDDQLILSLIRLLRNDAVFIHDKSYKLIEIETNQTLN